MPHISGRGRGNATELTSGIYYNLLTFFFLCNSRNLPAFKWLKDHDVLLAREILSVEPYKYKNRSRESGQAWDLIATNLNAIRAPRFRVSQKSVRDRARLLLKNFKLKIREEEKASGI